MTASHKVAVLEDLLERVRRNALNPAARLAARAPGAAAARAVDIVDEPTPTSEDVASTLRRDAELEAGAHRGGRSETIEGPPPRATEPRSRPLAAPTPTKPAEAPVEAKASPFDALPKAAAPEPESSRLTTQVQGTPLETAARTREAEKETARPGADVAHKPRVVALAAPIGSAGAARPARSTEPPSARAPAQGRPAPRPPAASSSTEAAAPRPAPPSTSTEAAAPRPPLPSTSTEAAAPRPPLPSTSTEVAGRGPARAPTPAPAHADADAPPPPSRRAPPPIPSKEARAAAAGKAPPPPMRGAIPDAPGSTRGSIPEPPRPRLDSRHEAKPAEASAPKPPAPAADVPKADLPLQDKRGTLLGMGQDFASALKRELAAAGHDEFEDEATAKMSAALLAEARAAMGERPDKATAPPAAGATPPAAAPAAASTPTTPAAAAPPPMIELDLPTGPAAMPIDLDIASLPTSPPARPDAPRLPKTAPGLGSAPPLFGAGEPPPTAEDGVDPLLQTVIAAEKSLPVASSARSDPPPSSEDLASTVELSAAEARERIAAMSKVDEPGAATIPEPPPFSGSSASAPVASDVAFAPTLDFGKGASDLSLDLPTEEPAAVDLPILDLPPVPPPSAPPSGVHVPTLQSATIDPAVLESARVSAEAAANKWATAPSSAAPAPAKPPSRAGLWVGVATFLAVVVGGGLFLALRSADLADVPPTAPPTPTGKATAAPTPTASAAPTATADVAATAAPSATASAAASAAEPAASASASATPSAAPSASAAASAAPSAAPSATPSATPTAAPVAAAPSATPSAAPVAVPGDAASLPDGIGYLVVQSSVPAEVYVNGKMVGPAGQALQVPCGARYLRIGKPGQPNFFISEGRSYPIACKAATTVTINPTPYSGGSAPGGAPAPAPAGGGDPY